VSKADKRERQRQNREAARAERERLMKRDRRMRAMRGLLFVLVPVVILVVAFSLLSGGDDNSTNSAGGKKNGCTTVPSDYKIPAKNTAQQQPKLTIDTTKTYTALIDTSCGPITVNLDAKAAPTAANNFVTLAKSGFYDGTPWHRAAKDFVIQGGDPKGDGTGGPGYSVVGETPKDNYPVGAVAAAKSGNEAAGTMGSQFFIVIGSQGATLPNDYARFGSVTKGQQVANKIGSFAPKAGDGPPTQKVLIKKITVTQS
jgi:cyclophilin family peptidyl-prolyl cis-trans isomerase